MGKAIRGSAPRRGCSLERGVLPGEGVLQEGVLPGDGAPWRGGAPSRSAPRRGCSPERRCYPQRDALRQTWGPGAESTSICASPCSSQDLQAG